LIFKEERVLLMKRLFIGKFKRGFLAPKESVEEDREVETVTTSARKYFGEDFPNSTRVDCPSTDSIRNLISEKKLPSEDLRTHLFSCSECFNDYRVLLEQSKSIQVPNKGFLKFDLAPLFVGAIAIILLCLGIGFWVLTTRFNSTDLARMSDPQLEKDVTPIVPVIENTNLSSKVAIENSKKTNTESVVNRTKTSDNVTSGSKNNAVTSIKDDTSVPLSEKNKSEIDLTKQGILRSTANEDVQKPIHLQSEEIQLRVKLPENSPRGKYEIYVVDEFGNALTAKKSIQVSKPIISVQLDLRKIVGDKKRLCIGLTGEVPDCVLINIDVKK
jgi:hypothetical protein